MRQMAATLLVWIGWVGVAWAGATPEALVQGIYEGVVQNAKGQQKVEARVVATGKKDYKVFVREQLGGKTVAKVELDGKTEGDAVRFTGKTADAAWAASYADGKIEGTCGEGSTIHLERLVRRPAGLGEKPPAGAVALLDGKKFEELTRGQPGGPAGQPWKHVDGGGIEVPKGGMSSKRQFAASLKLHVEFKIPLMPEARDQGRGNSGVYLPNGDEIQVLDSFGMTSYPGGGCGGIYAYKDPDAFDKFSLASLPPLEWQSFDVEYRVKTKDGKPAGHPRVTVWHNGIKIHGDVELRIDARPGHLHFQDHGNPVHYRNIWVLPLADK